MKQTLFRATSVALLALAALSACGGGNDDDDGTVVKNETQTIDEGIQLSYTLPPGSYRADITASNNGVNVSWVGGNGCTAATETRAYSQTCTLNIQGQLLVSNPTLLGLGGAEVTTIKITRL